MQRSSRLKKELPKLQKKPPPGIECYLINDQFDQVEIDLSGPPATPYESGVFKLEVKFPERYPFEPPSLKFLTPIYHPNIDNQGRICLDLLKPAPSGAWRATFTFESVLLAIQALLVSPNPDDPLMAEIGDEFRDAPRMFEQKAREWTLKYASGAL